MSELELPGMRDELIDYLRVLSDPEHQRREWIKFLPEEDIYNDELDYIIHFLYDDTHLADDPHQTVGAILRNDKEAEVIKELIAALNGVFSKHSIDLEGADYIKLPEWANVIDCAKVALREIQ